MKKTIVFITHDLSEAVKLGDRIAIMKDGEIVQVGTPEEVLTNPANKYVKSFIESVNRTKVITAGAIMVENSATAHLQKETPDELVQRMRERRIGVLPVVNDTETLVGEVRLSDLMKLSKEGKQVINPAIRPEVHSILSETILEDILPLLTRTNSPIWVVDEQRKFLGTIPLSLLIAETTGKDKTEINEIIQNAIDL